MSTQQTCEAGALTTQQTIECRKAQYLDGGNAVAFEDKTTTPSSSATVANSCTRLPDVSLPVVNSDKISQTDEAKSPTSTINTDSIGSKDVHTYPEGGLRAWLVVFGAWCGMAAGLGTANTIASFQTYVLANQLRSYDAGTVGWVFSVYTFIMFACGLVIGPAFDAYGPHFLILAGTVFLCTGMFLLGSCTAYWHFMLTFGLLIGLGSSLLFTPSVAAVGHFFNARRGMATGIAATGGAVGGIVFPLTLESLIPMLGFGWACRVLGFIYLVLCIFACLLIRSRLPPKKNANAMPDLRILRNPVFAVTVGGVWLIEWALFVPLTYISSYASASGFSSAFSYHILVILNTGSVFGRWLPGLFADKIGRFNASIIALSSTIVLVFAIWLPLGWSEPALIIFAFLFGFASGSNISLTPVCIGQLCDTEDYGRYYATCYTIVSVGCLTGVPIAGEILLSDAGLYWGLLVFVGMCYVGATITFIVARIMVTGWRLKIKY